MLTAETSQLGKEHDRWLVRLRPTVKISQVVLHEKEINNLRKAGCCQGSRKLLRELEASPKPPDAL
jgi:hypothetical protein